MQRDRANDVLLYSNPPIDGGVWLSSDLGSIIFGAEIYEVPPPHAITII